MTPAERRALARVTRRAAEMSPSLVVAILRAFKVLNERLPVSEVERLIRAGRITEAVNAAVPVEVLERVLNPATQVLTEGTMRASRATAALLPNAAAREVVGMFNVLNPRIVDAVRALDTTSIRSLIPEMQQAVREHIELGLRQGVNPRTMARQLTDVIGLAPNQNTAIANYRRLLEGGRNGTPSTTLLPRKNALGETLPGRALRDGRFDSAVKRAIKDGTPLTPDQIDRMVARYSERMRAFNAETHARTAALESQKLGQQLAWQEAKASGALGDADVIATWVTTLDGRERPEHNAMHGKERPLDGTYENGDSYPGESDPWNCRCAEVYRVARPSFALAA
jgi:hypothetical protein